MRSHSLFWFLILGLFAVPTLRGQSGSELVQVIPPAIRRAEPPSPDATAVELENEADAFRDKKDFLDALDYFRAAIAKDPKNARLYNKAGITLLMMQHYHDAKKEFDRALKFDRGFSEAYNNLGVNEYEQRRYEKAIKEYQRAIDLNPKSATYFANIGAAYYSRKEWIKAGEAYGNALQLDPTISSGHRTLE